MTRRWQPIAGRLQHDADVRTGRSAYQVDRTRRGTLAEGWCRPGERRCICLRRRRATGRSEAELEAAGFAQEDDVLDTWFSSALWPHSTLGLAGADAGTGLLLSDQRR